MTAAVVIWGYGLADIAIALVIFAAVCVVVYIGLRQMGVTIPPWVQQILWVLLIALVVVVAVKILVSL